MPKIKYNLKALCVSLLLALALLGGCAKVPAKVTIFYTTDTHGHLYADDESIGLGKIAALHENTPDSLLLDAGDFMQGAPLVNLTQGRDAVILLKIAGYSALALGNHEFDYGRETLEARLAEAAAPPPLYILSANVLTENGAPLTRPSIITERERLKIGIFGLTTPETATLSHPSHVSGLTFADPARCAAVEAERLHAQGCDIIIALAHIGSLPTFGPSSRDIAASTDFLDVFIDGHSHVELNETLPNGVLLVSSGSHGKALGKLTIECGNALKKHNTILHKSDTALIVPKPFVTEELARLKSEQDHILARAIAATPVRLDADRERIRTGETNFGNLCADALRHMTKADFALINAGCIRKSIPPGAITKGDLMAALPYTDPTVVKELTGRDFMAILEHSLSQLPAPSGAFAQISGLSIVANLAKPAGSRLVSATLPNGTPLRPDRKYTLALSDFLASGGDAYPLLPSLPTLHTYPTAESALTTYLKTPTPFDNLKPGRIRKLVPCNA